MSQMLTCLLTGLFSLTISIVCQMVTSLLIYLLARNEVNYIQETMSATLQSPSCCAPTL